jgi:CubicO group peptidase (beta-lactamase class C family)
VTLRELLSHSAMTSVHGFPGYDSRSPLPSLEQILDGVQPVNSAAVRTEGLPGSVWRYSGGGYEIIQRVVMDRTRLAFPAFMRQAVLNPLGMNDSTYEQPLPASWQANAAAGTASDGSEVAGKWHVYPEMMAAGLWTTPSDLARFAIALMNTARGLGNPVISAATGRLMLTPQIDTGTLDTDTGSIETGKDGLGVFLYGSDNSARFGHAGANEGFQAIMIGYLSGQGIVVMTNSDDGSKLAGEIFRSVSREYHWPPLKLLTRNRITVDPVIFDDYVGEYRVSPELLISVSRQASHLYLQLGAIPQSELFPTDHGEYVSLDFPALLMFRDDDQTRASTLVFAPAPANFQQSVSNKALLTK